MPNIDPTGHAPLDDPPVEPAMPTSVSTDGDMAQLLFCKLFHLNSYRKELIRLDASGVNVTTPYADATNEADECLAKLQALANRTLAVTFFPQLGEIQSLTTAMRQMESAITNSAILTSLVGFADTVINTIPAKGIH